MRLRGKVRLILTNESTPKTGEAQWIRLNAEETLTKEETILQKWQRENAENREDVETHFFAFDQGKDEEKRRSLKKDYDTLEKLYSPESFWWEAPDAEKRFSSFIEVLTECNKTNPALSIRSHRARFFRKIESLLNNRETGEESAEDNLISVLIEYLIVGKGTEEKNSSLLNRIKEFDETFEKPCQKVQKEQKGQKVLVYEGYEGFGLSPDGIENLKSELKLAQEIWSSEGQAQG